MFHFSVTFDQLFRISTHLIPMSSHTHTQTQTHQTQTGQTGSSTNTTPAPILHLRGPRERKPEVRWADGTIDNEHMNKKKTKICCIFHPADGDESCESSESSESDSSDVSDGEGDAGPNAYEKQPKYTNQSKVERT